jgi:uncharacterized protein YkwD/uncharacterized membrane protein required for colicin V production
MTDFSWPDLVVVAIVGLSVYLATRRGFVAVLLSLVGFVISLLVAFTLYPLVAQLLTDIFGWEQVWTRPIAFVGLWILIEGLFGLMEAMLHRQFGDRLHGSQANKWLAVFPGALQGLLTSAVLLTMVALLPVAGGLRRDVLQSPIGGRLVEATLAVERPLEGIFGPAARRALDFVTIKPPSTDTGGSDEGINLDFTVENAREDPQTEEEMLEMVNRERAREGLNALEMDEELREVARKHADDMFRRGYFSHDTPDGVDPFERMRRDGIVFGLAGENLALAPTLETAHEGLMNSPGHRANILKDGFNRVGIGVLDGGIYGKMFVQEFTD